MGIGGHKINRSSRRDARKGSRVVRSIIGASSAILMLMLTLITTSHAAESPPPDEEWLFERYQAGDIDTIHYLLDRLPDSSAAGKFFRGVFESDGDAARFYYDQVVALYPRSIAEGWALGKLWQYHYARGDNDQAQRYYQFLKERHPDHPYLTPVPDFKTKSGIVKPAVSASPTQDASEPKPALWAVQVGAFSKKSGADATVKKVKKYGAVTQVVRETAGQKLTVVMVGKLESMDEAQRLADQISKETGITGRIVALDKP